MALNRRKRAILKFFLIMNSIQQELMTILSMFHTRRSRQMFHLLNRIREKKYVPKTIEYYNVTIPRFDDRQFRSHFRLSKTSFEAVLQIVISSVKPKPGPQPDLGKRLMMFLWYIGNLESFRSMADRFHVSKSSLHEAIKYISNIMVNKIMPSVIRWPSGNRVQEVADKFSENNNNLPGTIGAIDGTHIEIKCPTEHKESYFNRKKYPSVVLLAVCNSQLEFTYVFAGCPGSTHDAGVLRQTPLFRDASRIFPQLKFIIGDSAFPLLPWLMKPFRDCGNLTRDQIRFNKVLSASRQVIERSFGFLKGRFRRLQKFDASDMQIIVETILSGCTLHNICLKNDDEMFEIEPLENDNQDEGDILGNLRGADIRQMLMDGL